jgi:hypothetical protein
MHAMECRSLGAGQRSTAALQRTRCGTGPTSGRHQAFAGPSIAPGVLVQRLARQHRLHHGERHEARALPAHARAHQRGDCGGQMVRGGTTKPISSRNGKAGTERHRRLAGARGRVQPLVERAEARHRGSDRRVQRVAVVDRSPRGCARPNRGPCATGPRDGV